MLDRLLSIGSAFDWITPSIAFAQDLLNGPPADFGIPQDAGWSTHDIKRVLTSHGIRVWGLMFGGDMIIFSVPKNQAKWAHYLLQREGVPILYAPAEVADSSPRPPGRQAQANLTTPLSRVFGFLDKLNDDSF